jgi:hypothetical protein
MMGRRSGSGISAFTKIDGSNNPPAIQINPAQLGKRENRESDQSLSNFLRLDNG